MKKSFFHRLPRNFTMLASVFGSLQDLLHAHFLIWLICSSSSLMCAEQKMICAKQHNFQL
jgi:hypothetical protein